MREERITRAWLAEHLPPRPDRAHKGDFGRVLVVAGSRDYPGAAVLTAVGAMRAGAGVVRIAATALVAETMAAAVPEATWMVLDDEAPGLIGPGGWRRLGEEAAGYDAVVIGPGLGRHAGAQRRMRGFVAASVRPTVVDADGLNALAEDPRWWRGRRGPMVVTPHPGEFSRLLGAQTPDAHDDEGRATAAAGAAARWGVVVVLKGAGTVIAAPDGTVLRSAVATPALATAGSGDVLAGMIAAFLACGTEALPAAACGVGVHAEAGVMAERQIGRAGAVATDVARLVPAAMSSLRGDRSS